MPESAPLGEAILRLDRVSKRFDSVITADDFSLAVEAGEFFTFLGPSGSGKSTILRMIAGLERPDSGRIAIAGRDMAGVPPWHRNLGMVFQQYAIFPHMTVGQNVAYGLRTRGVPADERRHRARAMLGLVGLAGMEDNDVTVLSGGEQQRVALARALVLEPAMLLLDEPLSALDEKIRREMQGELKRIQRKTGTTFLYVTHDQEEALTMSDRIAVLNRGRAVQCDRPEALFRRPRTRFVATFFRGCNVLEAAAEEAAAGRIRLALAGATVDRPAPAGRLEGRASVSVAIRGENLHLGRHAAACDARVEAELIEVTYRGTNLDYRLVFADGQHAVATSTRRDVAEGERSVAVGFNAEDVVPLED